MISRLIPPVRLDLCVIAMAALVFIGAGNEGHDHDKTVQTDRSDGPRHSCGALSLATLLRLESRDATPEQVAAHLPETAEHSLADLKTAAGTLGFSLRGVQISRDDWPLNRPALVQFKRTGGGHFVVIRRVGHTGQFMQIVDPTNGVSVRDADRVFTSDAWTGLALVPARIFDRPVIRFGLSLLVFLIGTLSLYLGRVLLKRWGASGLARAAS